MGKLPSPPVIEGTLKEPIYAMSFGILVSMWSMNIGSLLTPYYFAYIVSAVLAFECLLWFLDKPKKDYEVYKPPTESKRQEKAAASPAGETSGEGKSSKAGEEGTTSPKKKQSRHRTPDEGGEAKPEKSGKESRFRFRQKKNIDSPQSPSAQ